MSKIKKIVVLSVMIVIIIIVICSILIIYNNNSSKDNNRIDNNVDDDNTINEEENNDSNDMSKIYFNDKEYKSLEDVPEEALKEKFDYLSFLYEGKGCDSFSNDDIAIIIAHKLLMYETATKDEVNNFVEDFFAISNYELKEGHYIQQRKPDQNALEFDITKSGDVYSSNIGGYGVSSPYNKYESKEIIDNQIVLNYIYAYYDSWNNKLIQSVGNTKIYLESNGKTIFVKKIEYIEN